MKKLLVLIALLGAVAGGAYYLFLSLDALVKRAIEATGSDATKTKVEVAKVRIGLTDGKGAIQGFTIANPAGFREAKAFSLGGIQLKVDTSSVTKDPIVIDEIVVQAPEVVFEINKDGKANMNVLKENLVKVTGGGTEPSPSSQGSQRRFVIRKFVVEGGKVTARIAALGDKPLTAKLERFVLTNVGQSGKGATPEEISRKILTTLVDRVRRVATRQGLDKHIKGKVNALRRKVESKVADKLRNKLGVSRDEGRKALKNLFGR